MAGWMVHLRVADKLTSEIGPPSKTQFIAGNLAPDSGETAKGGPAFMNRIRRDMHDLDHLYYKEHPDFRAFSILSRRFFPFSEAAAG